MTRSRQNNALALIPGTLSSSSLGSYIHWVNQFPLLTETEEMTFAERLQKSGDLEAARQLIMSHLRFVVKIARGYSGYGLQQADLIQEGNIGLMKAVKRFNPAVGVRLVSFAVHWIRAEIHEFIIRNWRIVKIATTKAQRKLFFNIRKAAKKRAWFSESEIAAVAEQLNVSHQDVRQMEMRMSNLDESLEPFEDDSANENNWPAAPIHYLEDQSANPEQQAQSDNLETHQNTQLQNALLQLDPRSQTIIKARWLSNSKATLETLAAEFSISLERVRQLEKIALTKLKALMS